MIKKILVANRGEIAVRVMRSCREMEITSIAIFSEADRTAKHVLYADEAYCVGPAASKESYLNIEKIIEVAKECHADAIHPGYGFLSENATFARRCQEENIIFIGPDPETMEAMGDKISARIKMIEAGVPVVTRHTGESEKCGRSRRTLQQDRLSGDAESIYGRRWKRYAPYPQCGRGGRGLYNCQERVTFFFWRRYRLSGEVRGGTSSH